MGHLVQSQKVRLLVAQTKVGSISNFSTQLGKSDGI